MAQFGPAVAFGLKVAVVAYVQPSSMSSLVMTPYVFDSVTERLGGPSSLGSAHVAQDQARGVALGSRLLLIGTFMTALWPGLHDVPIDPRNGYDVGCLAGYRVLCRSVQAVYPLLSVAYTKFQALDRYAFVHSGVAVDYNLAPAAVDDGSGQSAQYLMAAPL